MTIWGMKRFLWAVFIVLMGCFSSALAERITPKIVTYNIKNYLLTPRIGRGGETSLQAKPAHEVQALLKVLKRLNPDILGIQEIGSEQDLADLRQHLERQGQKYAHAEWIQAGDAVRSQVLLSRWPLTLRRSQSNLTYVLQHRTYPMLRGILDVCVNLPNGEVLRCIGVHLKSRREVPEGDQEQMRNREAQLLRSYIDQILQEEPHVKLLLYGDFNSHRHEAALEQIRNTGGQSHLQMMDLKITDSRAETWTHYWSFADVYSRLDYFLVNRNLLSRVQRSACYIDDGEGVLEASDHRPLILILKPLL